MRGQTRYDEITHVRDDRHDSASKTVWPFPHFEMIDRAHTFLRADVHLRKYRTIYLRENR